MLQDGFWQVPKAATAFVPRWVISCIYQRSSAAVLASQEASGLNCVQSSAATGVANRARTGAAAWPQVRRVTTACIATAAAAAGQRRGRRLWAAMRRPKGTAPVFIFRSGR